MALLIAAVMAAQVLIAPLHVNVSANTDSTEYGTWSEVEEYCKTYLGKFREPTCADYVTRILRDCSYYPGTFEQHPRAVESRRQLDENHYNIVASNTIYRKSIGIDKATAVELGNWIGEHAKPGDILVWVRNTTPNHETTGCSHVSIYAGVKKDMRSYDGSTTWPAHYSDLGEGGVVVCQALWDYINKGPTSGRGYGIYIYRRPGDPIEPENSGTWEYDDNGRIFFDNEDNQVISRWKVIDGAMYYFDNTGHCATGLRTIDGKQYFFNSAGEMYVGWRYMNGKWYLFGNSGASMKGWVRTKNTWYYINDDGTMKTGLLEDDGKFYYFNHDGDMAEGWVNINGTWYFFGIDGAMKLKLDNSGIIRKLVDLKGNPVSGWQYIGGYHYYFDENGEARTGLCDIDDKLYYFSRAGMMMRSTKVTVDGVTYDINEVGYCEESVPADAGEEDIKTDEQ
ncbi:Putative cell wall binding repeat-containing protein [Ruminococcaceae bacterium YRB3002]|nr:Putative cell wall binding repeat-containing protein [Ruminococcaceae bacterium YRB3002]